MPSSASTASTTVRPRESSLDTSFCDLSMTDVSSSSNNMKTKSVSHCPQASPLASPLAGAVTHGFTFLDHPMSSRANNDTTTALDALASLASSHFSGDVTATNTATNTAIGLTPASPDSKSMPPPPRRIRRIRSSSNPEGMEKWDSYNYPKEKGLKRLHFVLPSTILEEELANANDMCIEHEKEQQRRLEEMGKMGPRHRQKHLTKSIPVRKIGRTDFSIQCQPEVDGLGLYGTSPDTVIPSLSLENDNGKESAEVGVDGRKAKNKKGGKRKKKVVIVLPQDDQDSDDNVDAELEVEEDVNESDLEPEELLRRARSRLFEDSSAENGMEKGAAMAFPHSLCKYKEVYNKNGRIGIYTPAERAAIIAKFNSKRTRRTWKKKIRYNCRKNLADRRMRVKGRFVKRAVEQIAINKNEPKPVVVASASIANAVESSSGSESSREGSPIPSAPPGGPLASVKEDMDPDADADIDMPDVSDPDAGFKPTESQPYRRCRRHTIT